MPRIAFLLAAGLLAVFAVSAPAHVSVQHRADAAPVTVSAATGVSAVTAAGGFGWD